MMSAGGRIRTDGSVLVPDFKSGAVNRAAPLQQDVLEVGFEPTVVSLYRILSPARSTRLRHSSEMIPGAGIEPAQGLTHWSSASSV